MMHNRRRSSTIDGEALDKLQSGHCPDCGHRGFLLGPRGGLAINIECGNRFCASRFNVTSLGCEIAFAQRLPLEDRQPLGPELWRGHPAEED